MPVSSGIFHRTFTAFALAVPKCHRLVRLRHVPDKPPTFLVGGKDSRLFSSFQAPVPPQSRGEAVYSDIDVSRGFNDSSPAAVRNASEEGVFVVTGASRGIGLEFVRQLVETTKGTIVACCRNPPASGLQSLIADLPADEKGRIEIVSLDLEDQDSIESATDEIKAKFNRIDMLLNVAGLLGDSTTTPGPERSIAKLEREWMEKTFAVNVFGPAMMSKELAPLMSQRRRKKEDDDRRPNSIIVNLSARVGSISDNSLGGWYSYRMSKSALNQATRTMAHELKRQSIWCIALHPGTTDTDLSKPFQKNVAEGRLFPVDFTVESLMKVVNSMEEENSGGLYDWAGKAIPF